MLQLRCTKKVQDQLGLKPADLSEVRESTSTLGDWYLHLFYIERRKALLFVNERTLASFAFFGVRKTHTPHIHEAFLKGLAQLLQLEGYEWEKIQGIVEEYLDYEFTKTVSRSVLGSMNEILLQYRDRIEVAGGLQYCDLSAIIRDSNREIWKSIDWRSPSEALHERLGKS